MMKNEFETNKKITYNPFLNGSYDLVVPRTMAQEEMLSSIAMDQDASLCYNEVLAIDFHGELNVKALEIALEKVIQKHDALKMVFSTDGKSMLLKSSIDSKLEFLEFGDLASIKEKLVTLPFDLVNGPCVKSTLVKVNLQHHVLFFATHHIICDGWSLAIILTELSEFYNEINNKVESESVAVESFADYALNESSNGINQVHRNYWLREFSYPIRKNTFPTDFIRSKYRTFKSNRIDFKIDSDLVAALKKLSAKNGASFYSALVATYNVLLFKITKSAEQVVGLSCAAQPAMDQHSLVGHLVNLLPLRLETAETLTFSQLLRLTKTKMLDAFDHHDYSYGLLVNELKNITRTPGEMPLLNTVFNIDQQAPDQGLSFDNLKVSYESVPRKYENFEIFINAVSRENILILECQFNTQLFNAETLTNWLENYTQLIKIILTNPEIKLNEIELNSLIIPGHHAATKTLKSDSRFIEVEAQVINVWKNVLGINNITNTDNFFSIGGHSLLAIEVATKLSVIFKINLTIKDIFEFDDVQSLAAHIATSKNTKTVNELPEIFKVSTDINVPVTNNQMQVWYLEEMFSHTTMHNLPSAIRIKTRVEKSILEKALEAIVKRHEALQTAIIVEDGVPIQKRVAVDTIELDEENATEDDIVQKLNLEATYVFNKKTPPLFKAKLFKLNNEEFVFFFMVHHAIWDGWSFDIFFEELNAAYESIKSSGHASFSNPVQIQYADYSLWMHELIKNKALDHQIAYWNKQLLGPLPILELPTDFKRPMTVNHEGATVPFTLTLEQSQKLRNYAKSKNNSVFNVLLTIFKEVLASYTGLEDIIVGAPVRGRVKPEMLNTIGYFVNAVALRSKISKKQTFEEKLKNVTKTCLEAFENQLLPFQLVLNSVSHDRDSSRTPIFQTFFSYQDVNNRGGQLAGIHYSQINIDKASTHTDLDLWIKVNDKKIEGAFEYRKDLFHEITIKRLQEYFMNMIDNLDQTEINQLPETHLTTLLRTWNNTHSSSVALTPFIFDFLESVKNNPDKVAVESSLGQLTYAELDQLSSRCALRLKTNGVVAGDLVGISLPRTTNLIVALLGAIKAGAGYVPLDPGFPQERLNYMIESATPKILITDEKISLRFKQDIKKIFLNDLEASVEKVIPEINGKNTAYVIYTSGSTGLPKGVEISHGAMANFLHSMKNLNLITEKDKLLAVTTLSFDIAVLELFLPLISGATVFLATSSEVVDGASLKSILEDRKITIIQATPSTYKLLINADWKGHKDLRVLCGGEAFPMDLAQTLIPMTKEVWNMYGPTETTVWSTCKKLTLDDLKITVGKPIQNTEVFILDEDLKPVPIGAAGQLFIGGKGLAKGYFNRNDLTAERFLKSPFTQNEYIYATGDLARFTFDGEIECLGRNDGQVKVRGYRIELGEIELQLKKIKGIHDAVVVTTEFRANDIRIVAYIEANEFNESQLRSSLSQKLPNYMVPSHFVKLEQIPKTLNGKVDKKQLPPFKEAVTVEKSVGSKQIQDFGVELEVRKIWQNVLGQTEIENHDNFFDIGGNSLLAVQVFSKLSTQLKINLPLSALLDAKDFISFVSLVAGKKSNTNSLIINNDAMTAKSLITISAQGNRPPLFCFHGVGGNVLNYVSLIPALKGNRPLLALQSYGLDGNSTPHSSIEKMAIAYIQEIKRAQPQGPYNLSGGSMGGLIALEVANRLVAAGDEVERLIMFDTFGPNLDLKNYAETITSNYISQKWYSLKYKVKVKLTSCLLKISAMTKIQAPLTLRLFDVESKNYQALWKYRPNKYEGDIHIIRSKMTEKGWYSDPLMGWKDLVNGKVHTYQINGTHEDFIESPELIRALTKLIN